MNLAKIFDLVRCSRNNISCNADILTIDDARRKYADYQYAIVNALDGIPVWICKTIEDAKVTIEEWQPCCCIPLLIVNLRGERHEEIVYQCSDERTYKRKYTKIF